MLRPACGGLSMTKIVACHPGRQRRACSFKKILFGEEMVWVLFNAGLSVLKGNTRLPGSLIVCHSERKRRICFYKRGPYASDAATNSAISSTSHPLPCCCSSRRRSSWYYRMGRRPRSRKRRFPALRCAFKIDAGGSFFFFLEHLGAAGTATESVAAAAFHFHQ